MPSPTPDDRGDTPLHEAAKRGDLAAVKRLFRSGGLRVCARYGDMGHTPLMVAVIHGHVPIVRFLIASGVDIDQRDEGGVAETALIHAVYEGNAEMCRILLEAGADTSLRGWMQRTALEWAENYGHDSIHALIRQFEAQRAMRKRRSLSDEIRRSGGPRRPKRRQSE